MLCIHLRVSGGGSSLTLDANEVNEYLNTKKKLNRSGARSTGASMGQRALANCAARAGLYRSGKSIARARSSACRQNFKDPSCLGSAVE